MRRREGVKATEKEEDKSVNKEGEEDRRRMSGLILMKFKVEKMDVQGEDFENDEPWRWD